MSTGQYLYIIIAFVFFMTIVVALNNYRLNATKSVSDSQLLNDSIALAQATIEEAWLLAFDEATYYLNTTSNRVISVPSSFTAPAYLGPESGESYGTFDDLDDYDGLIRRVKLNTDTVTLKSWVYYASLTVDTLVVNTKQPLKLLKVNVRAPGKDVNVTLEQIFSYF